MSAVACVQRKDGVSQSITFGSRASLTTSVAATLRCFRLSQCLSTMFFRSRLNFVLCLDSGVGKGGLGCL